jgi:hypothetical protein
VPTYIFSSGYGDVVAQAIIQSAQLENTGRGLVYDCCMMY